MAQSPQDLVELRLGAQEKEHGPAIGKGEMREGENDGRQATHDWRAATSDNQEVEEKNSN